MNTLKFYLVWFKCGRAYRKHRHLVTLPEYLELLRANMAPATTSHLETAFAYLDLDDARSVADDMESWLAEHTREEQA